MTESEDVRSRPPGPWSAEKADIGEPSFGQQKLTSFMGLRHIEPGVSRLTIRAELLTVSGMLLGPVGFALVDYTMGYRAWVERGPDETTATTSITINYLRSAREGEIECVATMDRRSRTAVSLRSEVRHADGRLLITALGSFALIARRWRDTRVTRIYGGATEIMKEIVGRSLGL